MVGNGKTNLVIPHEATVFIVPALTVDGFLYIQPCYYDDLWCRKILASLKEIADIKGFIVGMPTIMESLSTLDNSTYRMAAGI